MTKEQRKDKIIEIVEEILDSYSSFNESDTCVGVEMDADDIGFATDEIAERICREIFFNDTLTAYNEGYGKGCRSKMAYDYVACAKKYAVKDFAEKLKDRLCAYVTENEDDNKSIRSAYIYSDVIGVTAKDGTVISRGLVDELLKEYEK